MQQFIDNLISRLEEEKQQIDANEGFFELGTKWGYKQAIEIVNQLAEKYKGGWIPCSERLPEAYDIASKPILERPWYLIQTEQGYYALANYEILFGKNKWIGNAIVYNNVIAWKPIEPYQKEGE